MRLRRVIAGIAVLTAAVWFAQPPVPRAELSKLSPVMLDKDGAWLTASGLPDGRWRFAADVSEIDPAFTEALLRIEDRRFYAHPGVDAPAILRAAKDWWRQGEIVSGASTITMQLGRQYKPRPRTLRSKVIESFEALRFELHYSKAEILSQYLTRVSYGGNLEGIVAASRRYFGKSPQYLSADEIALLIALPQAPEARRPDRHAAAAKRGRDRILARMLAENLVTPQQYTEALAAPLPLGLQPLPQTAWVSAQTMGKGAPLTESRIDRQLQNKLERRLESYVQNQPNAVNAAAILVHAPSQSVVAHAANADQTHAGGWIDMTQRFRSPGSTLKPFIYGLGMDDGLLDMDSQVRDAPTRFGSYRPENFNRRYYGDVRISEALAHSLNIPAVAVLDQVGGKRLEAVLRASGAKLATGRNLDGTAEHGLSVALGGAGLRTTDLAALYTALANNGIAKPLLWRKSDIAQEGVRILSADAAEKLRRALADAPVPKGHMPSQLSKGGQPVAYKTGTSYGFRDSWAAGLSGEYVLVVWVGRPDGGPRPGATGRAAAAPILFDVFSDIDQGEAAVNVETSSRARPHRRVKTPDAAAPLLSFPTDGAEVLVRAFGPQSRGIRLTAQSAHGDVALYVDGKPVADVFRPKTEGFYKLTAVDILGQKTQARFRVLAADQTAHPGF